MSLLVLTQSMLMHVNYVKRRETTMYVGFTLYGYLNSKEHTKSNLAGFPGQEEYYQRLWDAGKIIKLMSVMELKA